MSPAQAGRLPGLPPFTLRDFRRLPLPAGGVNVQPPNLRTLVNVPTNLYVQAEVTTLTTTLVGFPVRVRATPVAYRWAFGDGAGLVTDDKGAPMPGPEWEGEHLRCPCGVVVRTSDWAVLARP